MDGTGKDHPLLERFGDKGPGRPVGSKNSVMHPGKLKGTKEYQLGLAGGIPAISSVRLRQFAVNLGQRLEEFINTPGEDINAGEKSKLTLYLMWIRQIEREIRARKARGDWVITDEDARKIERVIETGGIIKLRREGGDANS